MRHAGFDPAVDPAIAAGMLLSIVIGAATTSRGVTGTAGLRLLVEHLLACAPEDRRDNQTSCS